jgi:hypothetical protein
MTSRKGMPTLQDMTQALAIATHGSRSARQIVIDVELESRSGRRWHAVGGGTTLEEAITFARESAPDGTHWRVIRIEDLYGD